MASIKETFYSRDKRELARNIRDLAILCQVLCPECGDEMTSHELEKNSGHYYYECDRCGHIKGEDSPEQPDMSDVPFAVDANNQLVYVDVEEGA